MTDWWTSAYMGGPAVSVDGFPRPLYPPDAAEHGKKPSQDGPDVLAYKRAICHAGRWGSWDPESWDDSYSNAFSHGKSDQGGNLKWTGIAGFQRQQKIEDTGWLGEKTFNNMRYARISDPNAPHYGDPIIDSVCVQLINEAWRLFGGSEPHEGGVRQAALKLAKTQLGIKESPAGSNQVKYSTWYGMIGPWCAMFVTWCFETNTLASSASFVRGSKYAYVPYVVADARAGKNGLRTTDDPIPGDLICYDWSGDGEYDHIGIFEKWLGGGDFQAIEGNTSTSNNSNGGEVMRRLRNRSGQTCAFVRVNE